MGKLIGKAFTIPAPAAGVSAEPPQTPAVWNCPYCGKTYKTEKGLTDHIAKEHADAPVPGEE